MVYLGDQYLSTHHGLLQKSLSDKGYIVSLKFLSLKNLASHYMLNFSLVKVFLLLFSFISVGSYT